MDELAKVIERAYFDWVHSDPDTRRHRSEHIATAIIAWLGSDEVVERLALFTAASDLDDRSFLVHGWQGHHSAEGFRDLARAALSSITGGGNGR